MDTACNLTVARVQGSRQGSVGSERQAGPGKLAIQDMDKKYSFWVKKDLQLWLLTVINGNIMIYNWLVVWNMTEIFSIIVGMMIRSDFHIFRGVGIPQTR